MWENKTMLLHISLHIYVTCTDRSILQSYIIFKMSGFRNWNLFVSVIFSLWDMSFQSCVIKSDYGSTWVSKTVLRISAHVCYLYSYISPLIISNLQDVWIQNLKSVLPGFLEIPILYMLTKNMLKPLELDSHENWTVHGILTCG